VTDHSTLLLHIDVWSHVVVPLLVIIVPLLFFGGAAGRVIKGVRGHRRNGAGNRVQRWAEQAASRRKRRR
jgi:hypothetical protein